MYKCFLFFLFSFLLGACTNDEVVETNLFFTPTDGEQKISLKPNGDIDVNFLLLSGKLWYGTLYVSTSPIKWWCGYYFWTVSPLTQIIATVYEVKSPSLRVFSTHLC